MSIADKQSALNRSTRGQWHLYTSHRQQLEKLLVPAIPGGSICVLGAGNCNDLDLMWLTQVYRLVQLVDLDPEALSRGAAFQKADGSSRLRMSAPIDLTGLSAQLGQWKVRPPTTEQVQDCLRRAGAAPEQLAAKLGGGFDVVLSPCVLSQLLMPLHDSIGREHPAFLPMLSAIRASHFRLMVNLLAPGGRGVFAADVLSSAALPDLARVPHEQLPGVIQNMLAAGKCFSGLEPPTIIGMLTGKSPLSGQVGDVRTTPPWLWHLGLSKTYAVYAITFAKRLGVPGCSYADTRADWDV